MISFRVIAYKDPILKRFSALISIDGISPMNCPVMAPYSLSIAERFSAMTNPLACEVFLVKSPLFIICFFYLSKNVFSNFWRLLFLNDDVRIIPDHRQFPVRRLGFFFDINRGSIYVLETLVAQKLEYRWSR